MIEPRRVIERTVFARGTKRLSSEVGKQVLHGAARRIHLSGLAMHSAF